MHLQTMGVTFPCVIIVNADKNGIAVAVSYAGSAWKRNEHITTSGYFGPNAIGLEVVF